MSRRNVERMPYGEEETPLYERLRERLDGIDLTSDVWSETEEEQDGRFPVTVTYDPDGLEELFEDADGVYREIPLHAWDPTLTARFTDAGYVEPDQALTELDDLLEEWEADPVKVTFYHQEGLRARGTLSMRYDGSLDADTSTGIPFRVDVEQYVTEETASELLESHGV